MTMSFASQMAKVLGKQKRPLGITVRSSEPLAKYWLTFRKKLDNNQRVARRVAEKNSQHVASHSVQVAAIQVGLIFSSCIQFNATMPTPG
jgi:hypothetical protein